MDQWDLNALYTSFRDEQFHTDWQQLSALHAHMLSCTESDSEASLCDYLRYAAQFKAVGEKLHLYIELRLTAYTDDHDALKYSDLLNELLAGFKADEVAIMRWIGRLPIETFMSEEVNTHRFILQEIQQEQAHLLDSAQESLLAHMKNTGSNAWAKYKDQLIAGHEVVIDGQRYPLTDVLNMAYSHDADVRKKAYEAEVDSYRRIEQGVCACLNGIKGEVLYTTHLHGYDSELSRCLSDSRLSSKTLETLLEVMRENMGMFHDYLKTKARYLKHENGLPWYDLYAPVIDDEKSYSYQEGADYVIKQFLTFSDHLGNYAKEAVTKHWIDVYPRSGKVSGAFCENIMSLGESRFLLNYGNHFSDVITMAHELGHGFHGECLKEESILNTDYPMPIAETASTFCETIVTQAALKEANEEERIAILENALVDATQVICDIYSRFLFERRFFALREKGSVSVEETKALMIAAQKEAYGDGLDPDVLHPYMWTWKPHYYDPDYSFYNFPYAFGLLLAKGLYAMYQEDPEHFPALYERFLKMTGKASLEDVASSIGINLQEKTFWENSMRILKEDIDLFMSLMQNR